MEVFLLPYDRFSPYLMIGPGVLFESSEEDDFAFEDNYFKMQYGFGLGYVLSPRLSVNLNVKHHLTFTEDLDDITHGKQDDSYFNLAAGIKFNFGKRNQ